MSDAPRGPSTWELAVQRHLVRQAGVAGEGQIPLERRDLCPQLLDHHHLLPKLLLHTIVSALKKLCNFWHGHRGARGGDGVGRSGNAQILQQLDLPGENGRES